MDGYHYSNLLEQKTKLNIGSQNHGVETFPDKTAKKVGPGQ